MKQNNSIDRREMLKTLTLLTGYTLTAGAASAFLAGCKNDPAAAPGAVDAGVEQYIALAVNKFYKAEDQKKFLENFARFDKLATDKYKKTFAQLSDQNKDDILKILAEEWKKNEKDPHIFKEIRDLTVTGYCTSEAGAKQLLKYDPIPGPYKGCIDRASVGGVWAF